MNRKDLKKLIKPLVKECINEVILEEGMLSGIIREVVSGLGSPMEARVIEEQAPPPVRTDDAENKRKMMETKRKMLDAIGSDAYGGVNLFEGTEPLRTGGNPDSGPAPTSPLSGLSPSDPGIDISKLMPGMDKVWKKLI